MKKIFLLLLVGLSIDCSAQLVIGKKDTTYVTVSDTVNGKITTKKIPTLNLFRVFTFTVQMQLRVGSHVQEQKASFWTECYGTNDFPDGSSIRQFLYKNVKLCDTNSVEVIGIYEFHSMKDYAVYRTTYLK